MAMTWRGMHAWPCLVQRIDLQAAALLPRPRVQPLVPRPLPARILRSFELREPEVLRLAVGSSAWSVS